MEPESTIEATEPKSESIFNKPVHKYVALLLLVAFAFIGGWIGYTNAPVEYIESVRIVSMEGEGNVEEPNPEEIPFCTSEVSSAEINTTEWTEFSGEEGLFFKTIRPHTVTVAYDENNKYVYTVTDEVTDLMADIRVSELEDVTYFRDLHDYYYKYDRLNRMFSYSVTQQGPYTVCVPPPSTYLKNGGYAFELHSGDAGVQTIDYMVVLEPSIHESETNTCDRPLMINVNLWYDFAYSGENYENDLRNFEQFNTIVGTMVKNMQLKPTCS